MRNINSYRILFVILLQMLFCIQTIHAQKNFKILSYNVLEGFRGDSLVKKDFINWAKKLEPDIIAFQEMNNFTQKQIEQFAAGYGHPYAVMSKTDGYPVALTSKYPIVNVQKVLDNMHHGYLVANINRINVIVIHFSPISYRKRQLEVKEVLARADLIPADEMTVVMGDFNALSEKDASYYSENDLKVMKERELNDNRIRNLNNGKFDYSITRDMENAGFKDILWHFRKDFQPTMPTKSYKAEHVKRIDFIYVNAPLEKKAVSAEIIRDDVTDIISDHYPVLVTVNPDKK
jgi:exodeoxyribonuclease III